jgi:hypothetical protein
LVAVDPNVKLAIKEFACQIREEIKDGFTVVNTRMSKIEVAGRQRDVRVTALETTMATVDKSLIDWKQEVEASITSFKLELVKLDTFFDSDAKASSNPKPGVLSSGSPPARPSAGVHANGPAGHRVDLSHRGCGFERVYTLTHDLIKGTVHQPLTPPSLPIHLESDVGLICLGFHPIAVMGLGFCLVNSLR